METERGTPQGGNLSPMLSNIFLHYVLDLWFEKRIKRQVRGVCSLVRYADDFVCMVQHEEDAQQHIAGDTRAICGSSIWSCIRRRPASSALAGENGCKLGESSGGRTPSTFWASPITANAVDGESSWSVARPAGRSFARSAES